MSWLEKNYEKAALGGAAVVALGLAYLGWSKFSGVEQEFGDGLRGAGGSQVAVPEADRIPKAEQSMTLDRTWNQASDGDRPVNLFTGIPLFIKSSAPDKSVDPITDEPIHDPIPNTWWLEHRIDPGFADSPARDPDADGFSNLEEFEAKTDPNNAKSIPALIAKLMYAKDDSLAWALRPGFESEGAFGLSYLDGRNQTNKVPAGEMIKPGELFFPKNPMKDRFKLLGHEVRREMNPATNTEEDKTYVRVEDQRPNKKGTVYEIPAPLSEARVNEHLKFDRTAIFTLEALGKSGVEFRVEENTAFALPPESSKKDYFLKKVTPESVTVEYPAADGSRKTVEINKGSMPQLSE